MKDQKQHWTQELIEQTKRETKTELDKQSAGDGSVRLKCIFNKIQSLENSTTPEDNLKQFVLAISALVHHHRHGGLTEAQIHQLAGLAHSMLHLQGVKRRNSTFDFLYGELHFTLGLIYQRTGSHWKSVWEQQTSFFLSQRSPLEGKKFQALTTALQATRLGCSPLALAHFKRVYEKEPSTEQGCRAALEIAKGYRIAQDFSNMTQWLRKIDRPDLPEPFKKEIAWQELCATALQSNSIESLMLAVRRGKAHQEPSYILEAYLWSRAVQTRAWMTRFPRVRKLSFGVKLNPSELGFMLESVEALDECYEASVSLVQKLKLLGDILNRLGECRTIDRELLTWAAATRWLVRVRTHGFAAFTFFKYRSLCLTLTAGKKTDVFNVLTDLSFEGLLSAAESSGDPEKREAS